MVVSFKHGKFRNGSDAGATGSAASQLSIRFVVVLAVVGVLCFQARFMFSMSNNSMRLEVTQPSAREGTASSFELATRESLGFFDDVSYESWWMLKKRYLHVQPNTGRNRVLDEDVVKKLYVPEPHKFWVFAYEPEFTCPNEIRVYAHGDGGKWVCDPHRISGDHPNDGRNESCLIYSVGSNGKFEFEEDIQTLVPNCEIHTFDVKGFRKRMTMNFTKMAEDIGVSFHQWGVGQQSIGKENFKTFNEIVPTLGHRNKTIDIMKIDCEGCELEQFAQWLEDWRETGVLVRQILLEVHGVEWPATFQMFRAFSDAGYVIFHKEANFYTKGVCVEYAFVLLSPDFQVP